MLAAHGRDCPRPGSRPYLLPGLLGIREGASTTHAILIRENCPWIPYPQDPALQHTCSLAGLPTCLVIRATAAGVSGGDHPLTTLPPDGLGGPRPR